MDFVFAEGFVMFAVYLLLAVFSVCFVLLLILVLLGEVCDFVHRAVPLIKKFNNDCKVKKSGKLSNEQRLDLLEQKIDSIADIVISSSEEVK